MMLVTFRRLYIAAGATATVVLFVLSRAGIA